MYVIFRLQFPLCSAPAYPAHIMTAGIEEARQGPSKVWYLLPIFFAIIGGLVMYLVLRNMDRKMASRGMLLGILMVVVPVIIGAGVIFFGGALFR